MKHSVINFIQSGIGAYCQYIFIKPRHTNTSDFEIQIDPPKPPSPIIQIPQASSRVIQPAQARSCTDLPCLVFLVIVLLATLVSGIYFIAAGKDHIMQLIEQEDTSTSDLGFGFILLRQTPTIVGMLGVSIGLLVMLVFLTKAFPKFTVYSIIVLIFLVEGGIIAGGFLVGSLALAITFIFLMVLTFPLLCCYWGQMKVGIKLIGCASRLMNEKPVVYGVAGLCLLLSLLFEVFWCFAWVGVNSASQALSSSALEVLANLWYPDMAFWVLFLHYLMYFLVASVGYSWYLQGEGSSVVQGFCDVGYHLGSICFAVMTITFVTVLGLLAQIPRPNICIIQCLCPGQLSTGLHAGVLGHPQQLRDHYDESDQRELRRLGDNCHQNTCA